MMRIEGELLTQFVPVPGGRAKLLKTGNDWSWSNGNFLRVVEEERKSTIWGRWALLPPIPGQKFTIGTTFTSREDQGEFIFLSREQLGALTESRGKVDEFQSICEILYGEDSIYWITPKGHIAIYLNHQKIEGTTRLDFGDELFFGFPMKREPMEEGEAQPYPEVEFDLTQHDLVLEGAIKNTTTTLTHFPSFRPPNHLRILFKERETRPEAFLSWRMARIQRNFDHWREEMFARAQSKNGKRGKKQQGQNTKVKSIKMDLQAEDLNIYLDSLSLSRVFSYLSIQDLKTVRSVSRLWAEEGLRALNKKSIVSFDLHRSYSHPNESMTLFRYLSDMENVSNPPFRWNIVFPPVLRNSSEVVAASTSTQRAKFVSDLDYFILGIWRLQHNVSRLTIDLPNESMLDFHLRFQLLESLQHSLTHLELSVSRESFIKSPHQLSPSFGLRKLQSLTISTDFKRLDEGSYDSWKGTRNISGMEWLPQFILSLSQGKLSTLDLHCCPELSRPFLRALDTLPYLNALTVHFVTPQFISLVRDRMGPNSLKKLHFHRFDNMEQEDLDDFSTLVKYHAESLTSLGFILPSSCERRANDPFRVMLPILPHLLRLKVGVNREHWGCPKPSSKICFKLGVGTTLISYTEHFPRLQALSVWPYRYKFSREPRPLDGIGQAWEEFGDFFEIFFPVGFHTPPICPTLKELDILMPMDAETFKKYRPTLRARVIEMARMFPGVDNPWMNQERERVVRKRKAAERARERERPKKSKHSMKLRSAK